jgi:hypothetical protein
VLKINPIAERIFYLLVKPHRDRSAALREDMERLVAVAEREPARAS